MAYRHFIFTRSWGTGCTDSNACNYNPLANVNDESCLFGPTINHEVFNIACAETGSVELTVSGGTAPYDIEDLSSLSAGDYTTIVTDANGCETSVSFTISEPDALSASISVTNALCNDGLGSAELIISGGTAHMIQKTFLPYQLEIILP